MIGMVVGSAVFLIATQAAVNVPRAAFSDCLKQADAKARAEKVGAEAYADYIKGACSAETTKFKNALISFDVKNGIARKQAASDADLQIDDYIDSSANLYRRVMAAAGEKG